MADLHLFTGTKQGHRVIQENHPLFKLLEQYVFKNEINQTELNKQTETLTAPLIDVEATAIQKTPPNLSNVN